MALSKEDLAQILQTLFASPQMKGFSLGGGGGRSDNTSPVDFLEAFKRSQDPIGYANKTAALPSNVPGSTNAFASGQLFDQNRAKLAARPVLAATQGATAENQLRALEDPTFAKTMALVASRKAPIDRGVVTGVTQPNYLPAMARTPNGASGMLNPNAPSPFNDANWWQATGSLVRKARPAR